MEGRIITMVRIVIPPEKRSEILKVSCSLMGLTRVQPGCISCRMYFDMENENALSLVEEWKSQDALDKNIRSEQYRKILALLDMSTEPPEIQFNTVLSTAGLEAVAAVRSGEKPAV
jgi:quinol monooxygenase YgiN